jgi:hypothetical protein
LNTNILSSGWQPPQDLKADTLINLLVVAGKFEIPAARAFAIHHLYNLNPPLHPTLQLQLSRQNGIPANWHPDGDIPKEPNWIPRAVRSLLLEIDQAEMSKEEICRLDQYTWYMLGQAGTIHTVLIIFLSFISPNLHRQGPYRGATIRGKSASTHHFDPCSRILLSP